jgi:hypothetical protein
MSRVPKRIELLTNGTLLTDGNGWPGGGGVAASTVIGSLAGDLQAELGGTWVTVKDLAGNDVTFGTTVEMFNIALPECKLRVNGTLTGGSVIVVGY